MRPDLVEAELRGRRTERAPRERPVVTAARLDVAARRPARVDELALVLPIRARAHRARLHRVQLRVTAFAAHEVGPGDERLPPVQGPGVSAAAAEEPDHDLSLPTRVALARAVRGDSVGECGRTP